MSAEVGRLKDYARFFAALRFFVAFLAAFFTVFFAALRFFAMVVAN